MANWQERLAKRKTEDNYRMLQVVDANAIDFQSNDYLGLSTNQKLHTLWLKEVENQRNGSSGSRLISGNTHYYEETETYIAQFYKTESSLIVSSGFMANLALFSSVFQKDDVILYDEYIHASIREGIRLNFAKKFSFRHNDYNDLERKLVQHSSKNIYIITEGIFSMDGDIPCRKSLFELQQNYDFQLIIDEAHSTGILGKTKKGWFEDYKGTLFARIHTFGKALGIHGAAIVSSQELKEFLVNFSRPVIYSTAMNSDEIAKIKLVHTHFEDFTNSEHLKLHENCKLFGDNLDEISPIFTYFHDDLSSIEQRIIEHNIAIKVIKSPTVPEGSERLRICLHSYNTKEEIQLLKQLLS